MTQEERQLLTVDLCARLAYGVKVTIKFSKDKYSHVYDLREIDNDVTSKSRQQVTVWNYGYYSSVISYPLINCRPYLRPMSSMTEEEREELLIQVVGEEGAKYFQVLADGSIDNTDAEVQDLHNFNLHWINFGVEATSKYIDWLNAHHFDFRNLIDKGLALKAPKEMYKEEEK